MSMSLGNNKATIYQNGLNNRAYQTQTGAPEASCATDNNATIDQGIGHANSFNTASQYQSGYQNNAAIYQDGGNFNNASQTQTSHNDSATIVQAGSGNTATQVQH